MHGAKLKQVDEYLRHPRTSVTAIRQNGVRRGAVGDADKSGRGEATTTWRIVEADLFFEKEDHAVGYLSGRVV
jgi:hypothetical protein